MSAVLAQCCAFCGALDGQPCRSSVGGRPIVAAHMQRITAAAPAPRSDEQDRALRNAYARAVVAQFFGRWDDDLLERARKDRTLDERKPWVRRALSRSYEEGYL